MRPLAKIFAMVEFGFRLLDIGRSNNDRLGMPILDDVNGPMRPGAGYINMNIAAL
jgi:hypothetical protein